MKCIDSRDCFGKTRNKISGEIYCDCLDLIGDLKPYKDGECPFCKPEREKTKGKNYPLNPYSKTTRLRTKYRRNTGGELNCDAS